jgi:hypothetical protein
VAGTARVPAAPGRAPAPRPSPAVEGARPERTAPERTAPERTAPERTAPERTAPAAAHAPAPVEAGPPSAGLAEALGSIAGPAATPHAEPSDAALAAPATPAAPAEVAPPPPLLPDLDEDPFPLGDGGREDGISEEDALFSGTREIRTGRRASLRTELNEVRRTRTVAVIILVLAVLGAPLAFYAVRETANDPVFGHLGALDVPDWAAKNPQDQTTGSRWCIGECRLRQRIMRSERLPDETNVVYTEALKKAGWAAWKIEGCPPEGQDGFESCWQRDEYVLDLFVYQPECEVQLKTPDPSKPATPLAEAVCPPTVVTLKIINKVSFESRTG